MTRNENKTAKKTKPFKAVCIVLAVLLALYCAVYLVLTFATGDPLPMPLGFGSAVVLSGSMEPTLSVNDLIFIIRSGEYATGDIVVYSTGGTPVVHRIVSIDAQSGTLVTRGDANNVEDDPVPLARVKGKVAFSVPFIGAVPRFIRTVPGLVMILLVLFTLLFVSVRSKAEESEEEAKQLELSREIERLKKELGDQPAQDTSADERRGE